MTDATSTNSVVCKCGHHEAFHFTKNCVHGLVVRKDGVDYTNVCTCEKFVPQGAPKDLNITSRKESDCKSLKGCGKLFEQEDDVGKTICKGRTLCPECLQDTESEVCGKFPDCLHSSMEECLQDTKHAPKGCGKQWGNFICDGKTYVCGRCKENTLSVSKGCGETIKGDGIIPDFQCGIRVRYIEGGVSPVILCKKCRKQDKRGCGKYMLGAKELDSDGEEFRDNHTCGQSGFLCKKCQHQDENEGEKNGKS